MRFLREEQVALTVMVHLAGCREAGFRSVPHIAQAHGLTLPYLKKIMAKLRRGGLIRAKEGVAGGYRLDRDPSGITIAQILDAVADRSNSADTLLLEHCPFTDCCIPQSAYVRVRSAVQHRLRDITLKEFI